MILTATLKLQLFFVYTTFEFRKRINFAIYYITDTLKVVFRILNVTISGRPVKWLENCLKLPERGSQIAYKLATNCLKGLKRAHLVTQEAGRLQT